MKKLFACLLLAMPLTASPALAQDKKDAPKKELTEQQKKMGDCSAQAKGLKGDEYKKKHDECMKAGKEEKKEMSAQQKKMSECSKAAKGLKGDEYKKKRDECLKS